MRFYIFKDSYGFCVSWSSKSGFVVFELRFGLYIYPIKPVFELVKLAKMADKYSFDFVWVADGSPAPYWRDLSATMASIIGVTKKTRIGAGIFNPYLRHPALIASTMVTFHEMSGGRVVLGLGPGVQKFIKLLGLHWGKPVTAMREAVEIIRQAFSGSVVNYEGDVFSVLGLHLPSYEVRVPIYLAARRPMMLRLSGEVCDGVFLLAPLAYLPYALSRIRDGLSCAGQSLSMFDVVNFMPVAVSNNAEKAHKMVREDVSLHIDEAISVKPSTVLKKVGICEEDAFAVSTELRRGGGKAVDLITQEMIDAFSISGTPSECLKRIEEFEEGGVSQLVFLPPPYEKPELTVSREALETIKWLGEKVLPRFKQ